MKTERSKKKDMYYVCEKLGEYNESRLNTGELGAEDISRKLVDDGRIVAGINATFYWNGAVYVDALWVDEGYRGSGLGKQLLKEVEEEGLRRGAGVIHLDTFDFQAPEFYQACGYTIYGKIDDCPLKGHCRYSLQKRLRAE